MKLAKLNQIFCRPYTSWRSRTDRMYMLAGSRAQEGTSDPLQDLLEPGNLLAGSFLQNVIVKGRSHD
jgi:hypothetical protein